VSSDHGTLIVNRNDYHMVNDAQGFGVGWQICDPTARQISVANGVLSLA
jgi:hypothetical protein